MISTPGIGPATDGLSGFELFFASQPAKAALNATMTTLHRAAVVLAALDFMALPLDTNGYQPTGTRRASQIHTADRIGARASCL
ncbi:MAG: hypothetical protein DMF84_11325 [Acidobacteria bacterium]|nr:MAG: hypothetical protein DMF84_11325 [Acidobacteriota bacterium]